MLKSRSAHRRSARTCAAPDPFTVRIPENQIPSSFPFLTIMDKYVHNDSRPGAACQWPGLHSWFRARSGFMSEVDFDSRVAANDLNDWQPLVAIIGGGITGLAAAHRLGELEPRAQVLVLESEARPGGVLRTVRKAGSRGGDHPDGPRSAAGVRGLARAAGADSRRLDDHGANAALADADDADP